MQHERRGSVPVVHDPYHMDTLGAPFKVILKNGVTFGVDEKTGDQTVSIPDTIGLINAVVRARVCHPRKLNGAEIKFLRKSIGVRAKIIAKFLDMTPEHLSRCESGMKPMTNLSERTFRLFAFLASFCDEAESLLGDDLQNHESSRETPDDVIKGAARFVKYFLSLKINAAYSAEELCLEFCRKSADGERCGDDGDDDNWSGVCDLAA